MDGVGVAAKDQVGIGEKIKAFRTARRMSLRTLGDLTGTTASFLSQLERGLSGVNTSTLMRIAGALGVSLTDLFEDTAPPIGRVLRKAERPALPPAEGYRKMLLSRRPIRDMEVYIGEFDPNGSTGDEPYSHGDSQELFLVLRGEVELTLGEERHRLSAGDSIEYSSSVPHKTVNIGTETAEVLWMIAPPTSVADDLDKYLPRPGS
ncbi:helix-turn-helix domain-containing protein [Rhizobium sp. SG2393]|uniref:helix-turn-helix domain-containing protein n=1 Tax=Rhizobium sp. SG2393 TaxID=3276279 RepID=UPI00366F9BBD